MQGRADRLRNAMLERELDGFVVVDLPSVRWLTGFTGSSGLAVADALAKSGHSRSPFAYLRNMASA